MRWICFEVRKKMIKKKKIEWIKIRGYGMGVRRGWCMCVFLMWMNLNSNIGIVNYRRVVRCFFFMYVCHRHQRSRRRCC